MASGLALDSASSTAETAYADYRGYVGGVLARCGVPEADVPDLTQEVFIVLLRRIEEQLQPAALRGWLFQTARRVAGNYRRRQTRERARLARVPEREPPASPEDGLARSEAAVFITRFLEDLDEDGRRLFLLSEVEGVRGPQIADALGLKLKTAYSRVYALRRRFDHAAAREFGRPASTRAWLVLAGLGAELPRAFRRGLVFKVGAAVVLLLALLFAWRAFQPRGQGPAAEPPPVWDPTKEVQLRQRLEASGAGALGIDATLSGRVRRADGDGIAGATVCAWPHVFDFTAVDTTRPLCTKSGADGRYSLAALVPLRLRLTAAAPGFVPGELRRGKDVAFDVSSGERDELDIVLEPGGVPLSGVVEDMTGGPVDGVTIALQQLPNLTGTDPLTFGAWGNKPPIAIVSGPEGRFDTGVEAGAARWQAFADGYAPTRGEVTAPLQGMVIRLAPESVLAGEVVAADSGEPVAGIRVVAWADPRSLTNAAGEVETDERGRFRITGLPPGRYKPWASAPGRLGVAERSVVLGLGETAEDVRIPVSPAPIVRATVKVAGSEEPCTGGAVALREEGRGRMEWQQIGPEGEVVFPAVLPGRYRPQVGCEGHRSAPSYPVVVAGQTPATDLSWEVFPGATLKGQVLASDGVPASGALVTVHAADGSMPLGRTLPCDESGRFFLEGLASGDYVVTAASAAEVSPRPHEVRLGDGGADISLKLGAAGRVRGRVLDGDGGPVKGAIVRLFEVPHDTGPVVRTNDEGEFEASPLSMRAYAVAVARHGTARGEQARRIELTEANPQAEVELVLAPGGGDVVGKVVDGDGTPIPDALVKLGAAGRGVAVDEISCLTGSAGEFTLAGVPPGPQIVRAVAPDGASAEVRGVEAGKDEGLEIVVPATASASGTVVVDGEDPPRVFEVMAVDEDKHTVAEVFSSATGAWTLEGLRPGATTISAVTAIGRATMEVVLEPGKHHEGIELRLAGRVDIVGTIVSLETGEPMADYIVVATAFDDGMQELGKQAEIAVGIAPGDPRQRTGSDGRFVVPSVAAGLTNFAAFPKTYPESDVEKVVTVIQVPVEEELRIPATVMRVKYEDKGGRTGLKLARRDYDQPWEIESVDPQGPAATLDVRAGDTITAINGHDVTGLYKYLAPQLLKAPAGTTVAVTLGRDVTVQLTLAPRQ